MRLRHLLPGNVVCAALALLAANVARADGAFPDELQVYAPLDAPHRLVVSTNYGVLVSNDDGASWVYVCELQVHDNLVNMYGAGEGRIYALSDADFLASGDDGCTWGSPDAGPGDVTVWGDVFADTSKPGRVWALAYLAHVSGFSLLRSDDGAISFTDVYDAPGALLEGVESAHADPDTVYAAKYVYPTATDAGFPVLLRLQPDGGWEERPHPDLGDAYCGIAAVSPTDPDTLFLRVSPATGGPDQIAESHDRGESFRGVVTAHTTFSAFAVDADGTAYAADRLGHLWVREVDAGFVERTGPSTRCLAARAGKLFACGDTTGDGFILGESDDHGASFHGLVVPRGYQTAACAVATCGQVIGIPDAGPVVDAGSGSDAGSEVPDAGRAPLATQPKSSGCGCGAGGSSSALLLVPLLGLARRRRDR